MPEYQHAVKAAVLRNLHTLLDSGSHVLNKVGIRTDRDVLAAELLEAADIAFVGQGSADGLSVPMY